MITAQLELGVDRGATEAGGLLDGGESEDSKHGTWALQLGWLHCAEACQACGCFLKTRPNPSMSSGALDDARLPKMATSPQGRARCLKWQGG